jgi:hypothetical protein
VTPLTLMRADRVLTLMTPGPRGADWIELAEFYAERDARWKRIGDELAREREVKVPPPWPAPEVACHVVERSRWSGAWGALAACLSDRRGWRVRVTHARGTRPTGARHQPGPVVDSWAVRARAGNEVGRPRCCAIWYGPPGGRLSSDGVLRFGDRYPQWVGIEAFKKELVNL